MRIECEVCSATYTIDDSQLSDQPIGAQCPYCGHVRLVKKGDAGAPSLGAGPPPQQHMASDLSLNAPPPIKESSPFLGNAPPNPFGGPNGGAAPFGASPFGASPFGAPPFGAAPEPPPRESSMQIERTSQRQTSQSLEPQPSGATCQVCGTSLTDEFDKVIGLCDVHQRDRRGAEAPPSKAAPSQWYVRSRDGRSDGPMELEDLRQRIRSGEYSPDDDFSPDGVDYGPIGRFKDIAYLASLKVGGQSGASSRSSYARPKPGVSIGKLITPLLLLGVAGGVAFLAFTQR